MLYSDSEAARAEYASLREESLESQKQRVALVSGAVGLLGALFAYLIKDGTFYFYEAAVLTLLTLPPSLYSYSTRIRERRIADYQAVFLPSHSVWARALRAAGPDISLRSWQRSSVSMVAAMVLLDLALLIVAARLNTWAQIDPWMLAVCSVATFLNIVLLWKTVSLPSFRVAFEAALTTLTREAADR